MRFKIKNTLCNLFYKLFCFCLISVFLLTTSCSTKSEKTEHKVSPQEADPVATTKLVFPDSLRATLFDEGIYENTIYSDNGRFYLDVVAEIAQGFGLYSIEALSPEDIVIQQVFPNKPEYNSSKIKVGQFSNIKYSYNGDIDKSVVVLSKTIMLDDNFYFVDKGEQYNSSTATLGLKDRMPIVFAYSEIIMSYKIGEKQFEKKIVPKFIIKPVQKVLNNFLLKPTLQVDKNSNLIIDVNINRRRNGTKVYFPNSEKVFLNIYEGKISEDTKVFFSGEKTNFMQVIDENLPDVVGESKNYSYILDSSKVQIVEGKLCEFELGLNLYPTKESCHFSVIPLK